MRLVHSSRLGTTTTKKMKHIVLIKINSSSKNFSISVALYISLLCAKQERSASGRIKKAKVKSLFVINCYQITLNILCNSEATDKKTKAVRSKTNYEKLPIKTTINSQVLKIKSVSSYA